MKAEIIYLRNCVLSQLKMHLKSSFFFKFRITCFWFLLFKQFYFQKWFENRRCKDMNKGITISKELDKEYRRENKRKFGDFLQTPMSDDTVLELLYG